MSANIFSVRDAPQIRKAGAANRIGSPAHAACHSWSFHPAHPLTNTGSNTRWSHVHGLPGGQVTIRPHAGQVIATKPTESDPCRSCSECGLGRRGLRGSRHSLHVLPPTMYSVPGRSALHLMHVRSFSLMRCSPPQRLARVAAACSLRSAQCRAESPCQISPLSTPAPRTLARPSYETRTLRTR